MNKENLENMKSVANRNKYQVVQPSKGYFNFSKNQEQYQKYENSIVERLVKTISLGTTFCILLFYNYRNCIQNKYF